MENESSGVTMSGLRTGHRAVPADAHEGRRRPSQRRKAPNPPISLPKLRTCRVLGPKGRISDAMTQAAADRYAWAQPGVEDLGGGVHRIPLPLPIVGVRAAHVSA